MEIKELMLEHYTRYPHMKIQDLVKLIYQNEFGCSHMIDNESISLKRLNDELDSLSSSSVDAFEDIGNGLCRMNLGGLKNKSIDPVTVNRFFVDTANSISGSIKNFENKLEELKEMSIYDEDARGFIEGYKNRGYPPVSHSDVYKELYHPSYRVVKMEYCKYFDVFDKIDMLKSTGRIVNVAIDGNCGAGKSMLAALLEGIYDCNVFHLDHFFLRPYQRTPKRLSEPGGNIDHERFGREIIEGIRRNNAFSYQVYDCQEDILEPSVAVDPKRLNIIEGSYSMRPEFIDLYDIKIFMKIDKEEQSRRILERSGSKLHKRFVEEWIPMEDKYFDAYGILEKADLVYG
jgi:uridine kinase